jgi:hypothetical protein
MLVWLITRMSELTEEFPQRLDAVDDREFMNRVHRKRRYFAPDRDTLYLQNPNLADKYVERVGKYWLATNLGRKETTQLIRAVANASGASVQSLSGVDL